LQREGKEERVAERSFSFLTNIENGMNADEDKCMNNSYKRRIHNQKETKRASALFHFRFDRSTRLKRQRRKEQKRKQE
jgi:hypothetical protein